MHLSPRDLSNSVHLSAPLLDSTTRRCAQPCSRRGRATRAFLQHFPFELETPMRKSFSAAAAALTILAASSAHAETQTLVMLSTTLSYQSQDVAEPAGAARMLSRIERTARRLCSYTSPIIPHGDARSRACEAQSVARAVDSMAAPLVTAAFAEKHAEVTLASR